MEDFKVDLAVTRFSFFGSLAGSRSKIGLIFPNVNHGIYQWRITYTPPSVVSWRYTKCICRASL